MEPYEEMKEVLRIENIEEANDKLKKQKKALKDKIRAYLLSAVILASAAPLVVEAAKKEPQVEETQEIATFEEVTQGIDKLISGRGK